MKKEEIEKYIGELSPEMQEKARACKDMQELNDLLAENDVELSEEALQAVSGGCSQSSSNYDQGDLVPRAKCPECKGQLYYWDMEYDRSKGGSLMRLYCKNPNCSSYNGLWYNKSDGVGAFHSENTLYRY